jgi:hypothetical protein
VGLGELVQPYGIATGERQRAAPRGADPTRQDAAHAREIEHLVHTIWRHREQVARLLLAEQPAGGIEVGRNLEIGADA